MYNRVVGSVPTVCTTLAWDSLHLWAVCSGTGAGDQCPKESDKMTMILVIDYSLDRQLNDQMFSRQGLNIITPQVYEWSLLYTCSSYVPILPSLPSPLIHGLSSLLQLEDLDSLIRKVDSCTGMAKCQHVLSQLEYIFDSQVRAVRETWCVCAGVA